MIICSVLTLLILIFLSSAAVLEAEQTILIRENFDSLTLWEPLNFPKIKAQQIFFNLAKDYIRGLRISSGSILFPEKTVTAIKVIYFGQKGL